MNFMVCGFYLNKDIKTIRDRPVILNSGCLLQSLEAKKYRFSVSYLQPIKSGYLRDRTWPWAFEKPELWISELNVWGVDFIPSMGKVLNFVVVVVFKNLWVWNNFCLVFLESWRMAELHILTRIVPILGFCDEIHLLQMW